MGVAHPFQLVNPALWQKQLHFFQQAHFAIPFSQEIVKAKINNYIQSLRFVEHPEVETILPQLLELKRLCENKTTRQSIRGVEGRAAALFYRAFGALLDERWQFPGRRRHPPPDPINAALSLGYTVLYHHLTVYILNAGLNPWQGIFHQSRANYCALSSDLQEEFRFLIDRLVLTLIRRRQWKPEDFPPVEKMGTVYRLPKTKKALFLQKVEEKLQERIQLNHPEGYFSYREIMALQIQQLKQILQGERLTYQAFRRR